MAHEAHLYRVGETWYFRVRFPADLRPHFNRTELKRTLRTKSLVCARQLLRLWNAKTVRVFTLMRTGVLPSTQVRQLAAAYLTHSLQVGEDSDLYADTDWNSQEARDSRVSAVEPRGLQLSELFDKYIKEHMAQGAWVERSRSQAVQRLGVMLELIGDRPVKSVMRDHVVGCLEKLQQITLSKMF